MAKDNDKTPKKRETFDVTLTLGKRQHARLEEIGKPFGMTVAQAAETILKKHLEKD